MKHVTLGKKLTVEDVYNVAFNPNIEVKFDEESRKAVQKNRTVVENILKKNKPVYGINTGFGSLSDVKIKNEELQKLQLNLIRSHSAGVGKVLEQPYARAMLLLRANNLALGYSGVRPALVDALLFLLNNNIIPQIPEKGSVGASGDLAPLAHLTLALIGEGNVLYKNKIIKSSDVYKEFKKEPIVLEAKEGLALINGTQFMSALGTIALIKAENLAKHADIAAALSIEGVKGSFSGFDLRISKLRPHRGQLAVSENLLNLADGSEIAQSHKNCSKVQDPYSFRCIPQVHGAVRDAISYLRNVLSIEINSVTDNPLVFDEDIISAGNFHGEPVALAFDFASIALTELTSLSERRIDKLLTPSFSGLSAYLTKCGGLNSGFMIAQYTSASLLNESRVLSTPSSIDNIPTSNNKEDHVSMGATGVRKLLQIVDNLETVLAIEYMIAVQACDFHKPLKPGKQLVKVVNKVRNVVEMLEEDRVISDDILKIKSLVNSNEIVSEVELV